jgi:four helix bundle protein
LRIADFGLRIGNAGDSFAVDADQFKRRTKTLASRVLKLVDALPRTRSSDVLARQLLRSATSVGANYRAACRARSPAEFIAKLGIVEEELDESAYWMELIVDAGLMSAARLQALIKEVHELLSMVVASIKTARRSTRLRKTK